jgi:hypothetical protein
MRICPRRPRPSGRRGASLIMSNYVIFFPSANS